MFLGLLTMLICTEIAMKALPLTLSALILAFSSLTYADSFPPFVAPGPDDGTVSSSLIYAIALQLILPSPVSLPWAQFAREPWLYTTLGSRNDNSNSDIGTCEGPQYRLRFYDGNRLGWSII